MESSIWDLLQHSFKDFKLPNLMLWLFGSLIHYTDCLCSISRDGGAFANHLFVLTTHANFFVFMVHECDCIRILQINITIWMLHVCIFLSLLNWIWITSIYLDLDHLI
jgi:hypothetical protein